MSDDLFSYTVRDLQTGYEFKVYSGDSGPAYGGPTWYDETETGGYVLNPRMGQVLAEFDAWVEAVIPG